eukprot:CAMPEP_0194359646 /NCGR_PEP_ID=MMETSP0174-20130528/6915_1 /TAXON_ID=216777 /ORGANISM="Proboscia alata, Strain PI-D3" /LENGTH=123 /DNA_ID=CAMNT_0039130665 /DNA_START=49 /DNA_END=420 /DNA_ORIENTATION=-
MGMVALSFCGPPILVGSSASICCLKNQLDGQERNAMFLFGGVFLAGIVGALVLFGKCDAATGNNESFWTSGPCWSTGSGQYWNFGLAVAAMIGVSTPWFLYSIYAFLQLKKKSSSGESTSLIV